MVEGAGGLDDDKARRRVVASCRHETMVIALGVIPAVAEDSAQDLIAELAVIDAEPETAPEIVAAPDAGDDRPGAGTGADTSEEPVPDRASVADLAARNAQVTWAPDRDLWHELLYRLSGRRLYRRYRTPARLPQGRPLDRCAFRGAAHLAHARGLSGGRVRLRRRLPGVPCLQARLGGRSLHPAEVPAVRPGPCRPGRPAQRLSGPVLAHAGRPLP